MKLNIKKQLAELTKQMDSLRDYQQDLVVKFDSRSEKWQESEKGEEWQEKTDELDSKIDELETLIDELQELID